MPARGARLTPRGLRALFPRLVPGREKECEAYLPASSHAPSAQPRLSCPDEDCERPQAPKQPPSQRAHASCGDRLQEVAEAKAPPQNRDPPHNNLPTSQAPNAAGRAAPPRNTLNIRRRRALPSAPDRRRTAQGFSWRSLATRCAGQSDSDAGIECAAATSTERLCGTVHG